MCLVKGMSVSEFPELSPRIIRQQVVYQSSSQALATAQGIVATKATHTALFITNYVRSRRRTGHDSAVALLQIQNRLQALVTSISQTLDRQALFRIEAQVARLHWRVFCMLCRLSPDWRRVYPHASDGANVLLNTGYTMLGKHCAHALRQAGLLTQLGVYHGDTSRHPLVYDFMECFRLPLVDAVVIGVLARQSNYENVDKDSHLFKKTLAKLSARYQSTFNYNKRCEKLINIIDLEALALKRAIASGKVWQPRQHSWSHHKRC